VRVEVAATFTDAARPRRINAGRFSVTTDAGRTVGLDVEALGPAVAMPGLGYGGYDDGLGLGVWRGAEHLEHETWDVSHPADVTQADGTVTRPVHRIQPVRVTQRDDRGTSHGTGSLTFIAEGDLERLRVTPLDH